MDIKEENHVWYSRFLTNKQTEQGVSVNGELAQESHKPVIRKFKKRKVYASIKDNIWVADLVEMRSLSYKKRGVRYLLCVVDVFTKYAWVKPLKGKKAKKFLMVLWDQ